jgi:molybdopterin molybdotransferase
VLPRGCDTVVPYERFTREGDVAKLPVDLQLVPFANIARQGEDYRAGELLLPVETVLRAPHFHTLASVGCTRLAVFRRARWALLDTGDELVEADSIPKAHQIRRSNVSAITAEAMAWGIAPGALAHLPDDGEALRAGLERVMKSHEVLVITGGVSRGARDLVPGCLAALGFAERFHSVAQQPGKPMWFGVSPGGSVAVGLPGNPVSSLFTFRRYVLPFLLAREGKSLPELRLAVQGVSPGKPGLTRFVPVVADAPGSGRLVRSGGSGDYASLAASTGFIEVAPGTDATLYPYYPWGTGAVP